MAEVEGVRCCGDVWGQVFACLRLRDVLACRATCRAWKRLADDSLAHRRSAEATKADVGAGEVGGLVALCPNLRSVALASTDLDAVVGALQPLVPALEALHAVQHLSRAAPHGRQFPALALLPSLRWLELPESGLCDLGVLRHLPLLEVLNLEGCVHVHSLAPLRGLRRLRALNLCGCVHVDDPAPLAALAHSLAELDLSKTGCPTASVVALLFELSACLRTLALGWVPDLPLALVLRCCPALSALRLPGATLEGLGALDALGCPNRWPEGPAVALRALDLSNSVSVTSSLGLARAAPNLQALTLAGCARLDDPWCVSGLLWLQSLDLGFCANVRSLHPLAGLERLERLSVSNCGNVTSLHPLPRLPSLRSLNMSYCNGVVDIACLGTAPALEELVMQGCQNLTDLTPLAALGATLRVVRCSYCRNLRSLAPLGGLPCIEVIDARECEGLVEVEGLGSLRRLSHLDLRGCRGVQADDVQALVVRLPALSVCYNKWFAKSV